MVVDTVITGGTLVTATGMRDGCVAINEGVIVATGAETAMPEASVTIDASGNYVLPGIVDPHVHIEDPFSMDTYRTATEAAAIGGVTTFIDFAWSAWVGDVGPWTEPGSLQDGIQRKKEKGEKAVIDYSLHAGLTREDESLIEEIPTIIADEGIPSFKMLTTYEIGLGNGFMDQAIQAIADHDGIGLFHTEDTDICDYRTEKYQDVNRGGPTDFPDTRPDYAEAMSADDIVRMAIDADMKYYGVHTTCEKSADAIAAHMDAETDIIAETCTHYTTVDRSLHSEMGHLPKCNPPLREPEDIEALFDSLSAGNLTVVSSDHCAYRLDQKQVDDWWDCPNGNNSLQTSFPVFYDEAVNRRGFDPSFVVEVMSTNPAETFGLSRKGTLESGTDADIVLFDPNETYTITADDNVGNGEYSVYEGREVTGRVKKTLVRGDVVAEDRSITAEPGYGRFQERDIPEW